MPNFKVTNNTNTFNEPWITSTKFNSRDRIVNEQGEAISSDYEGRQYQIIEKKERTFSTSERFYRGLSGTGVVICTLGLALFSKSVRNLFIKPKENIRFAIPLPSKEEITLSKQELEAGISIPETAVVKIQTCMASILQSKEEVGIKYSKSQPTHRVFTLDTSPDLIFKMASCPSARNPMNLRYQQMILAQTVVRTHQLSLLVIPHAKLFIVNVNSAEYEIIAEEKLDITPNDSTQERYFQDYAGSLDETIRQLAVFICKTGYSDVEWRNNPILNNSLDENGNRKIALIDTEEMSNKKLGLFGGRGRRGLIQCVNETQGEIVKIVAMQHHVDTSPFKAAYVARKKELEENRKLMQYYATRNIIRGDEPIHIDISTLDFFNYPEKTEEYRTLTLSILKMINDRILKSSPEKSLKIRRHIVIDTSKGLFQKIANKPLDHSAPANAYKTDEEYYNATPLGHVLKKLKDLGAIYKLIKQNKYGCYIQA